MSQDLSEDLKYLAKRLERGVEWVQRPIISRSPTPIAEHEPSPPPPNLYEDVMRAHEKFIRDYPGDSVAIQVGNESHYRMVPKDALGFGPEERADTLGPQNIRNQNRQLRARGGPLDQKIHPLLDQKDVNAHQSLSLIGSGFQLSPNLESSAKNEKKAPRRQQMTNQVRKTKTLSRNRQSEPSPRYQTLRRSKRIALLQQTSKLHVDSPWGHKVSRKRTEAQMNNERMNDEEMNDATVSAVNAGCGDDSEEERAINNATARKKLAPIGRRKQKAEQTASARSFVSSGRVSKATKSKPQIPSPSPVLRPKTPRRVSKRVKK